MKLANNKFCYREKTWIGRSRHWNISGKRAWKIQPHQKGQGLRIPAEIAEVPVWIEWDRDVGDWRKKSPTDNHRYARLLTSRWRD